MEVRFERVKDCPHAILPERKTKKSGGYDFYVSENTVVPSIWNLFKNIPSGDYPVLFDLETVTELTKKYNVRPTLVPTGVKAYIPDDAILQLSVRSSCPLKNWLVLANGVGIIDADYVDNIANEGAIYFQLINFFPFDIELKAGDCIGQGVIIPYLTTTDDNASGERVGGFGSTNGN